MSTLGHLIEKALPSVGGLEFFQNFFCTLNNTCYEEYVENDGVKNWDHALIPKMSRDISPILREISKSPETLSLIRTVFYEARSIVQLLSAMKINAGSGAINLGLLYLIANHMNAVA